MSDTTARDLYLQQQTTLLRAMGVAEAEITKAVAEAKRDNTDAPLQKLFQATSSMTNANFSTFALFCDAPGCGHEEPVPEPKTLEEMLALVGTPCPKCGANLLTEEDARDFAPVKEALDGLNDIMNTLARAAGLDPHEIIAKARAEAENPNAKRISVNRHKGETKITIKG